MEQPGHALMIVWDAGVIGSSCTCCATIVAHKVCLKRKKSMVCVCVYIHIDIYFRRKIKDRSGERERRKKRDRHCLFCSQITSVTRVGPGWCCRQVLGPNVSNEWQHHLLPPNVYISRKLALERSQPALNPDINLIFASLDHMPLTNFILLWVTGLSFSGKHTKG